MKRRQNVRVCILLGVCLAAQPGAAEEIEHEILSPVFEVDRPYKSMLGPEASESRTLFSEEDTGLVWITGFGATVVDEEGEALPQDFMCHTNLRYAGHGGGLQKTVHQHHRLFTISQGQTEVNFHEGFGIPILANRRFTIDNQVLNLNVGRVKLFLNPMKLRFKNTVSIVRDEDLETEMVPLYQVEAGVFASLEGTDAYYGTSEPTDDQHGAGCSPGTPAGTAEAQLRDEAGQKFTYHWVLQPGREVRRTLITPMLGLEFQTKIHYIAVHMHPYAESLALRDLTANETLFVSRARSFDDKLGLQEVEFYSSKEGIPVYTDHEYELVSTYNNTSGDEQDAMALVYLYLEDKRFERSSGVSLN